MENQLLLFFSIGGAEIVVIVLVIIMFFGSKKIPELARSLGKGMRELKNATNDIQQEIRDSTKDISSIKDATNVNKQMKNFMEQEKESSESITEENINPNNTVSRSSISPSRGTNEMT